MNWGNVIVWILGAADLAVGIVYGAVQHDWARASYWIFAAGICVSTIFMGGR